MPVLRHSHPLRSPSGTTARPEIPTTYASQNLDPASSEPYHAGSEKGNSCLSAGAWIDLANEKLGLSTRFIGGTKGSHLVLDHPELRQMIGDHEFFFENKDGRIVLVFPLYDRLLVGTSDLQIENPDEAFCTDEEIEYFLSMIARVFPQIKAGREHIVFQFSGVRPLAYSHVEDDRTDHVRSCHRGGQRRLDGIDFPRLFACRRQVDFVSRVFGAGRG